MMKLDVYVDGVLTGALEQVDLTRYVFTYQADADPARPVSLLMPVRTESWAHRFLHPIFQVSLPEGSLRQLLTSNFAKRFERFGDTELLALVGSHLIGRIKVTPHGSSLVLDSPQEDLQTLLSESPQEVIDHYIGEHARYSGVSGAFPKFLAKSPAGGVACDGDKCTLTFDNWIIKADDDDHPNLVLNEYFGLLVAREMGLPTPEIKLSDDGRRIAIRRFDITQKGEHLGFEDMCSMLALNASDKFSGSVERIVKTINDFCTGERRRDSLDQFYEQYVACMAIRNGDAHLKNFGLLYGTESDVRLAPVYDMLTMAAYAPRAQNGDAMDEPALSFGGVRRWPVAKTLKSLADRCLISSVRQTDVSQRLCAAMLKIAPMVATEAGQREEFASTAKRMLELWSCGIRVHSEQASLTMAELAASIEAPQEEEAPTKPSRALQFAMHQRGG